MKPNQYRRRLSYLILGLLVVVLMGCGGSPNAMNTQSTDCRSEVGITVGLIDSLIAIARVLAKRDLAPSEVQEALKDFRADEDVAALLDGGA